jgi:hypothetical protein
MSLPFALWLPPPGEGITSAVTVQLVGPAAAAAAAEAPAASVSDGGVSWGLLDEQAGFSLLKSSSACRVSSAPGWRRWLPTWGSWYLWKAQAVRRWQGVIAGEKNGHQCSCAVAVGLVHMLAAVGG